MSLFLSLKSDRKWLKRRLKLKQSRKPFAIYGLRYNLKSDRNFGNWKSFKNDEKCFIFYLKLYFHSQDVVLTFWSYRKKGVKIRLISKLMSHSLGNKQFQYIYCPNNSRSKGNQTMQYVWLIDYDMSNIFLKNHTEKMVAKLFPDSFL